jgi:protein O-GlcNAc transferase
MNRILNYSNETTAARLTAILQSGLAYHQQGDLEEAEHHYRRILTVAPMHADALHLLGVLCNQKQDNTAAIDLIRRAIQIHSQQSIFHTSLGNAFRDAGRFDEAIDSYRRSLQLKPDLVETYINLGTAYQQTADFKRAVSSYQKAIALKPNSAEAHYNLANTYKEQRFFAEAIDSYQQVIILDPMFAEAYYNLAIVLEQQGQAEAALDCLSQCLNIRPLWAEAHNNLGNLFKQQGLNDEALTCYQKAVELKPGFSTAHNNLGNAFKDQGCHAEAIACYQRALHADPHYAEAYLNLGITLAESDRTMEAIAHFEEATRLNPEFAEAHNYMGVTLGDMGRRKAAIDCFLKALTLNPADNETLCHLIHQLQHVCDWKRLAAYSQKLGLSACRTLSSGQIASEPPFIAMARHADLEQQLINARAWCRKVVQPLQRTNPTFSFESRRLKDDRLIIGYLSADFHDHATAHLMLSIFGLHNRDKFEINCYSYGPDDQSEYRRDIRAHCDRFVDVRQLSHSDAAGQIFNDGVDILVDLKGHTRGARLGILAYRPAPVQVHYLGYPGTTGADFIDYLITDRIVTPHEHAPFYSERLAFMPHSYQVNDDQQKIAARKETRQDHGLPEKGFVFSSFNLPYKIDAQTFDCWMRILNQVPGSVLWLFKESAAAIKNLRREADASDVDPRRLVFSAKMAKDRHLARLQLAGLTLDTRIVNGHTTTSDSLWAGVPVVTLMGDQFPARVSASLLKAIGLTELIVTTLEDYEQLAVRLASHPGELDRIKTQLAHNRLTTPLFDTPRFVGHLEVAYQKMWHFFQQGRPPQQFEIVSN